MSVILMTAQSAVPTAAHASSPATSEALLTELSISQPVLLRRLTRSIPSMLPKAYRWVGEMHEIAEFVGEGGGDIYRGMASTYERVEQSVKEGKGDVETLQRFVEKAKELE